MVNSISHTGLVVRDLDLSVAFYEGLGLVLWKRMTRSGPYTDAMVGISGVTLEWAKMHAPDGSEVELLQYHSHPDYSAVRDAPSNRAGCSHVAFLVDDLAQACDQLLLLGGSVVNYPAPEWKSAYCHDPDGIIVEFVKA
jgi:catechol 2,3-dioxygenase-like lactoylglutathione lyase family enzyme